MEALSPLDASFLHIETPSATCTSARSRSSRVRRPPYDEFAAMVAGKLGAVPRYRQKVRFVPLGLGRPLWVDDPHFNLGYHLRHTALPAPGGEERAAQPRRPRHVPAARPRTPLWEMWMVEGLEDGHWALVSKVHHCMVDGVVGDRPAHGRARLRARRPRAGAPRSGARSPSRAASSCWLAALRRALAQPVRGSRAARSGRRARPARYAPRGARRGAGPARPCAGSSRRTPPLVAQRADRPAPPLGLGAHDARRRQDGARARSAAPSTTSCSP